MRKFWAAAGALAGLVLAAPLAAQDLDQALAAADALAAKADYAGARAALRQGIADPALQAAVLGRYGDIRNRLAEWAFRERRPRLEPADLFAGTVEKWQEKKRAIELSWAWDGLGVEQRAADFIAWKEDWLFRVPVGGSFTLELQGTWPAKPEPVSFLVGVDATRSGGWRITPGYHRSKVKPEVKMPRRAERFGEPREMLEASAEGLEEPSGNFSYVLEVKNGQLTLRSGNKKLASYKTAHAERLPGFVGFQAPGLTRFRLVAELEQAVWEARQNNRYTQLLETFRNREYDLAADMPAWFGSAAAGAAQNVEFRPPDGAPESAKKTWDQLRRPDSLDFESWSKASGLQEPELLYAQALALAHRGAWKDGEAKAAQALNQGLRTGPVMALRARAQFFTGHGEAPFRELQAQLEKFPDDLGYELARLRGRAYGPKAMLETLDRAIASGALAPRVLRARDQLAAALQGPAGGDGFRYEDGPNKVLVLSDGDKEFAERVGKAVFAAREACVAVVPGIFTAKEPLTVLHFGSDGARAAFCLRLGLEPQTAGYLPELRLSLFAGDPDKALERERLNMAVWLQHLDGTLDVTTVPEWFLYGNRAFFAAADFAKGRVDFFTNMAMARRAKEVPPGIRFEPAELMLMKPEDWRKKAEQAEAESWVLVHFFHRNEIEPYAGRMARYFQALARGLDRAGAFQEAFADLPADGWKEAVALHRKAQVERVP